MLRQIGWGELSSQGGDNTCAHLKDSREPRSNAWPVQSTKKCDGGEKDTKA